MPRPRAVGLVVAGLKNILRADGGTGFFHLACDHLGVGFAFQLAGAGDNRKRAIVANDDITNCDLGHEVTCSLRIDAVSDNIR